jgi:methylenetetrahydrofolate dehydrogenase (NADP+) / methenyltetrahydrofolate cyclohydrolase
VNAQLLDGKATAAEIRRELAERMDKVTATGGRPPGLGTVLVGDDPGSHAYVAGNHRDCAQVGIASLRRHLPADAIQRRWPGPHQLPTNRRGAPGFSPLCADRRTTHPRTGGPAEVTMRVNACGSHVRPDEGPAVGASPTQVGRNQEPISRRAVTTAVREESPSFHEGEEVKSSSSRSRATVTLYHGTLGLARHVHEADIVIAAAGSPGLIAKDMLRPGAAALDVGITRTDHGLVGDVHPDAAQVAGWLAPMPGGVGPMTRAMLLANVVDAAERNARHRTNALNGDVR